MAKTVGTMKISNPRTTRNGFISLLYLPLLSGYQLPSVCSTMPSSRATIATGLPVLITSFTASSLYSGVNSRRLLPIVNILSFKVSTKPGHGHPYTALHCTGRAIVIARVQ